jgi:hypothetical protein
MGVKKVYFACIGLGPDEALIRGFLELVALTDGYVFSSAMELSGARMAVIKADNLQLGESLVQQGKAVLVYGATSALPHGFFGIELPPRLIRLREVLTQLIEWLQRNSPTKTAGSITTESIEKLDAFSGAIAQVFAQDQPHELQMGALKFQLFPKTRMVYIQPSNVLSWAAGDQTANAFQLAINQCSHAPTRRCAKAAA